MKKLAYACLLAVAGLSGSAQAVDHNTYVYEFTGKCTALSCHSSEYPAVDLILSANYVPGTSVGVSNFIGFAYENNSVFGEIYASHLPSNFSISGKLPSALNTPAKAEFSIHGLNSGGVGTFFSSHPDGTWNMQERIGTGHPPIANFGIDGKWKLVSIPVPLPVPEPETYAMLLAGLGLVASFARRRKPA